MAEGAGEGACQGETGWTSVFVRRDMASTGVVSSRTQRKHNWGREREGSIYQIEQRLDNGGSEIIVG